MNRTQIADIMKRLQLIPIFSIVTCTLLSSCALLVSSPLPHTGHHHHDADYGSSYDGRPAHRNDKTYHGTIRVPAEGGIYEIDCADDDFFISYIIDSTMPLPVTTHNGRCGPMVECGRHVNGLTYDGPFYSIACYQEKHNWVIKIAPFRAAMALGDERDIMVHMSDESDYSDVVFLFKQSGEPEPLEYIR